MTILKEVQIKLAEQLLLSVKNKEMIVEYNELAERIDPPIHWRQVGKNILKISKLCHELGLPLLSAKVVNKNSQRAGEGFYPLYEEFGIPTESKSERELFRQELEAIRNCKEWYKLEDYLGLHIGFERPDGVSAVIGPAGNSNGSRQAERWIVACNPKNYNVDAAFSRLQMIDWKQGINANVGDTVYIYVTAPIKAIKYKCIVTEVNKPQITIDDSEFVVDGTPFNDYGKHMTLRLEAKLDPPVSIDMLREVGIDRIQGPIKARPDVVQLLESRVKANISGTDPLVKHFAVNDAVDEALVSELKTDPLTGAPVQFQYQGKPKAKAEPVDVSGRATYPRDKQTAINALSHAKYRCEIDENHPTFLRKNSGKPYTEPHHLIPMAASDDFPVSLDVEENIVSLCSNCHNQIHYGQGSEELLKKLYNSRRDDLKRAGLDISFEQLLEYYQR